MKTIAIINQKGGVGKTTLTANLGVALAHKGKKVLMIDLDPQANLTYSFGLTPNGNTVSQMLQTKKTLETLIVQAENVFIAPSSIDLADVEISLVNKTARERFLKNSIAELNGHLPLDFILIDCPPSLSVLTLNALNASTEVLIPLQVEVLAMHGLKQLLDTIQEVKEVLNPELAIAGIAPSMYDGRRKLSGEVLNQIKLSVNAYVFKTCIRECVKVAEAPSFGRSVLSYAPHSRGAEDFRNLAEEFLNASR